MKLSIAVFPGRDESQALSSAEAPPRYPYKNSKSLKDESQCARNVHNVYVLRVLLGSTSSRALR